MAKKLIAREGLIILGILLMALVLRILSVYLIEQEILSTLPDVWSSHIAEEEKNRRLKEIDLYPLPEVLSQNDVTKLKRYGLMIDNPKKLDKGKIRFLKLLPFFVLSIYPFYWLIRYVVWAFKTLRKD